MRTRIIENIKKILKKYFRLNNCFMCSKKHIEKRRIEVVCFKKITDKLINITGNYFICCTIIQYSRLEILNNIAKKIRYFYIYKHTHYQYLYLQQISRRCALVLIQ